MRVRSQRLVVACLVLYAAGARAACSPGDVALADPALAAKRCWNASDLGLPAPLGGVHFSSDGTRLEIVAAADSTASAIHTLPVTRDAGTHEVTDLGLATGSFPGMSPAGSHSGLDAGL